MKKEYVSPEFLFLGVTLCDVLTGSTEDYSSYGSGTGDDWDNPIFDNDALGDNFW